MPTKEKSTTASELLSEVRDMRDMLEVIERRSKYLKPDSFWKSARKELVGGIMRGVGIFIGGTIVVAVLAIIAQRLLSTNAVSNFIGEQIEQGVSNAIRSNLPQSPFNGPAPRN